MFLSSVDIIVVNWNAGEKLAKALQPLVAIENKTSKPIRCFIVDNNSSDNSLSLIESYPVTIIRNDTNLGFGKACNIAFEKSTAEYVLLLNPDAQWSLQVLQRLIEHLACRPDWAAIGPQQVGSNNEVMRTCGRFPTFFDAIWECTGISKIFPFLFRPAPIMIDWDHKSSREVDHLMGSFLLLRRAACPPGKLFDERYFMYYEDLDLSRRLHDQGYKSFYDHSQTIFHEGGGTSKQIMAKRLFYSIKSRQIYWNKYFTRFEYGTLMFLAITIEPIIRLFQAIIIFKFSRCREVLKAYSLWFNFKENHT